MSKHPDAIVLFLRFCYDNNSGVTDTQIHRKMSFRSRSRTIQPAPRRRSLSSSRIPTTSNSTNYYLNNSPSFANARPLSSGYSSSAYTPSNYISQYSSRENLYSIPSSHYSSGYYNGSSNGRRDSYGGGTTYKNPYASDSHRYSSPYISSYDNGITTASLCLSSYGSKNPSSYNKSSSTSYKSDYTPRHSNLSQSRLSGSTTSLSSYGTGKSIGTSTSASAGLSRSQSFKDPERKGRAARRSESMKSTRSMSISSEKSEGYEVRIFLIA